MASIGWVMINGVLHFNGVVVMGTSLITTSHTIPADFGVYAPSRFEIPEGVSYELADGAILEIG